ncbi:MAG TPA: biotin--[acetyl-CoA-carboxylase] ligase [Candidatus Cybelea sp.]|nr:biotin--[acetyl-CoA-carboxylase] ligase [Candidatus Cybelea sp.]
MPVILSGFELVPLDDVDSTNDEAKRRAEAGAASGTLVWTRRQSSGRGRRGRVWESPYGNCYSSLILRPRTTVAEAAQVSFVAALAVAEAVAALVPAGRKVTCKWPNDVLIDGAKCAGILLESRSGAAGIEWLVVGVGINVASAPAGIEYPATSLAAAGATASVEHVLERYAARMSHWLERWRNEGFGAVRSAWLGWADGLGQPVRVRLGDATLVGLFESLDEAGALVLATPDGGRRRVAAGDVFRAA